MRIVALVVMVFALIVSLQVAGATAAEDVIKSKYSQHSVIRIDSDADFTQANGVVRGNGSASDPYVISGWSIDARGKGAGIYVGNVTSYFVIENCRVGNASQVSLNYYSYGGAIIIHNATHAVIRNVTVENSYIGVYVHEAPGTMIYNVTASGNGNTGIYVYYSNFTAINASTAMHSSNGILVDGSNNVTVEFSNVSYNSAVGLWLSASRGAVVRGNTFIDDGTSGTFKGAIYLRESRYATIAENAMVHGSLVIDGGYYDFTTHTVVNNTVNGKDLVYISNDDLNNATLSGDFGEIILANVQNVRIEGVNISDATVGIEIAQTRFTQGNIVLRDVSVYNMSLYGLYLVEAPGITVENSTFVKCDEGMHASISGRLTVNGSVFADNTEGAYLDSSDYVNVTSSLFLNSKLAGIHLAEASDRARIENCTFKGNDMGIYVNSDYSVIRGNLFLNNREYGVYLEDYTYGNLIYGNSFYYNHDSGDSYRFYTVQAYDDGNNMWNTTSEGNYWHDWANNNDTNDMNGDGIVDWPYRILGGSNPHDYRPVKKAVHEVPPLPPLNVRAVAGRGYVNVTWDAPRGNGTYAIVGYVVYRNGVKIAEVSASHTWYNDTSVVAGQTYVYSVAAVNPVGEGDRSEGVEATPSGEVPEVSSPVLILAAVALIALLVRRKI